MSDYIVRKTFSLDQEVATVPPREAIAALRELNQALEESQPQGESVPASAISSGDTAGSFLRSVYPPAH